MYYSATGLLAAAILLIENQDILLHSNSAFQKPAWKVYRQFLISVLVYYAADITWGILESGKHDRLLFADTSVYFVAMAVGIVLWTRYIVVYLDEGGTFERLLTYAGRAIAFLVTVMTIINFFHPVLFTVDKECVYHALPFRYIILISQIILLFLISAYALSSMIRHGSMNGHRQRYRTLGSFGLIMAVCLTAQLWYPYLPLYATAYMLGTCLLRAFVIGDEKEAYRLGLEEATRIAELKQSVEKTEKAYRNALRTSSVFENIVSALSEDYFNVFYIDLDTDDYIEYGSRTEAGFLSAENHGTNFFEESKANARSLIYEEDRGRFLEAMEKEKLQEEIRKNGTFITQYRLLINGVPTYVNMKATCGKQDSRHLIIGINSIDAQMKDRAAALRAREERKTYMRLSALVGNLIVLYFVDPETERFTEFSATRDFDELGIAKQGDAFFRTTRENGRWTVHPEDYEMFCSLVTLENVLHAIDQDGMFSYDYRLMRGGLPTYVRLRAARIEENGKSMLIIGLLDEDAQIRREQKFAHDLSEAKRMATVDALTGVKNKHAYQQWEERINAKILSGDQEPFAVAVCDINNMKTVNDRYGHKEGDACIRQACSRICRVFDHSPVFRIGGDEFVVLLTGEDYARREELLEEINELPEDLSSIRAGETISTGMARYRKDRHASLSAVFEEADQEMYRKKESMKAMLDSD